MPENIGVSSNGTSHAVVPVSTLAEVDNRELIIGEKMNELNLGSDRLEQEARPVLRRIVGTADRTQEFAEAEIQGMRNRSAAAHAHSISVSNRMWEIQTQSALSGRAISTGVTAMFQNLDFNRPREDFVNMMENLSDFTDRELALRTNGSGHEMALVRSTVTEQHTANMNILAERDREIASFKRVLLDLLEIQKMAASIIRDHQMAIVDHQLKSIRDVVSMVITNREDLRKSARQKHEFEQTRAQTHHQHNLENRRQSHHENVDIKNLDASRQQQERADALAVKRVEIEEVVARCKHELEISRENAKKPSFWDRLAHPFFRFL